jgi:hypothetical protein
MFKITKKGWLAIGIGGAAVGYIIYSEKKAMAAPIKGSGFTSQPGTPAATVQQGNVPTIAPQSIPGGGMPTAAQTAAYNAGSQKGNVDGINDASDPAQARVLALGATGKSYNATPPAGMDGNSWSQGYQAGYQAGFNATLPTTQGNLVNAAGAQGAADGKDDAVNGRAANPSSRMNASYTGAEQNAYASSYSAAFNANTSAPTTTASASDLNAAFAKGQQDGTAMADTDLGAGKTTPDPTPTFSYSDAGMNAQYVAGFQTAYTTEWAAKTGSASTSGFYHLGHGHHGSSFLNGVYVGSWWSHMPRHNHAAEYGIPSAFDRAMQAQLAGR